MCLVQQYVLYTRTRKARFVIAATATDADGIRVWQCKCRLHVRKMVHVRFAQWYLWWSVKYKFRRFVCSSFDNTWNSGETEKFKEHRCDVSNAQEKSTHYSEYMCCESYGLQTDTVSILPIADVLALTVKANNTWVGRNTINAIPAHRITCTTSVPFYDFSWYG